MDVMVKPTPGGREWLLSDLLGRSMGAIRLAGDGRVHIEPDGNATATMTGMRCGPFATLDEALAMIETHTRGVCRREPGEAHALGESLADRAETSTDISSNASAAPE